MVYPALLPLMCAPRLPVADWTDAPRWFKWTRPFCRKTKSLFFCACAIIFQTQSTLCVIRTIKVWGFTKLLRGCPLFVAFLGRHPCKMTIYHFGLPLHSGVPRWGREVGVPNPPSPKFRRPSIIVSNSTRFWLLLKIAEFRTPTPEDVRKRQ